MFFFINKYLIARFMFRYCTNNVPVLFNSYFECESDYHNYNTRSAQHFHATQVEQIWQRQGWNTEEQLSGMLF